MQPPAWSSPAFEPLEPGDPPLIGGYRVLARLGAGGMGRVYLATTQSGRRLAVKVVRPEFADDPEFRRRFQQEITAAQRVQSLYTAPVIDAHPDGPQPWMATAHVPGPSLAHAVAELGPLPTETVRTLVAGIAEALQAIHNASVIHRDLKPSNVLLAEDGPRVIDFGIARAADSTPLTRTGMRIGSPQFMSPEQALGRESTPAIDVFALGSVAFFAATGRTPFGDGPDTAVLFRIAHEQPNLDGCPAELRSLVERCLAKDPAERPPLRAILAELEPGEGLPGPDWLPQAVTSRLPAFAAEPPGPRPLEYGTVPSMQGPTAPVGPPPGRNSPVPPGQPPQGMPPTRVAPSSAHGRNLAIALGAGATGLVVLLLLIVVIASGDDGKPVKATTETTGAPNNAAPSEGVPPTDGAPTSPSAPAPGPAKVVGTYKGINLTSGYMIDFAGDPKHPSQDGERDFTYDGNYFESDGQKSLVPAGTNGSYESCRDDTRYIGGYRLVASDVGKGRQICIVKESGVIGLVTVRGYSSGPSKYVTIDLTVWQGSPLATPTS